MAKMERAEGIIDIRRHTTITITRASQKWWRNLVALTWREKKKEVELTRSVLLKVGPAYWVFGVDAQLTGRERERENVSERERENVSEREREKGE